MSTTGIQRRLQVLILPSYHQWLESTPTSVTDIQTFQGRHHQLALLSPAILLDNQLPIHSFNWGRWGQFICFIGQRSLTQGNQQSEKITTLTVEEEEEEVSLTQRATPNKPFSFIFNLSSFGLNCRLERRSHLQVLPWMWVSNILHKLERSCSEDA